MTVNWSYLAALTLQHLAPIQDLARGDLGAHGRHQPGLPVGFYTGGDLKSPRFARIQQQREALEDLTLQRLDAFI